MPKRKHPSNNAASPGSFPITSPPVTTTTTTSSSKSGKWMNSKKLKRNNLSKGQSRVVELALSNKSVFFTGAAGSGKSYLLRELVCQLEKQNQMHGRVFVTAPTGLAAWHLGGSTIHSFAGVKDSSMPLTDLLDEVYDNDHAVQRWQYCRCLIIDEISMIDAAFLHKLDSIARAVRQTPRLPFGGIQLIFSGDFFQLPPVDVEQVRRRGVVGMLFCWCGGGGFVVAAVVVVGFCGIDRFCFFFLLSPRGTARRHHSTGTIRL